MNHRECSAFPWRCKKGLEILVLELVLCRSKHKEFCFAHFKVSNEPGNRYNLQLINALVLYVGTQAIAHIHNKGSTPSMSTITHSAHMDIFQNLAVDLDTEGEWSLPVFRVEFSVLFATVWSQKCKNPSSHNSWRNVLSVYLFTGLADYFIFNWTLSAQCRKYKKA